MAPLAQAHVLADLWMSTAQNALDKNASSFAVLPMTVLLKQGGVLDQLKAIGYGVQEPR